MLLHNMKTMYWYLVGLGLVQKCSIVLKKILENPYGHIINMDYIAQLFHFFRILLKITCTILLHQKRSPNYPGILGKSFLEKDSRNQFLINMDWG